MKVISEQDFYDNPHEVLEAVEAGETYQITQDGEQILELSPPTQRRGLVTAEVIERLKHLPRVDYAQMRREVDEFFGNEDRLGDDDPWERGRG
ncbi:PhdYeFM domain-containing protein [Saccharothrix sp. S26]|uniref:type II toxin-antitoxin system Phd/YefM family antitoxin n=1 Tax=Saccharothrix sp. S26 TaxID=2907215 RepID=UPI001F25C87E|nr:PhdYeFM domain-containing protein [Saccharothrix sp. S26]MCE6999524.1 PhdYeFM domain-containing protein [Saccharothrix sp. S26]